jgi:hypothetical protein
MINHSILNNLTFKTSVLWLALLLGSCAGLQVDSSQTKGVTLEKYKTYAWGKPGDPDNDPNYRPGKESQKMYGGLIKRLVDEELLKKGFVLDTLQPDAIIVFNSRVEENLSVSHSNITEADYYGGGFGYYSGGYYSPARVAGANQKIYEEGMLYVSMMDTKTREPLWGGWAKKKLTPKTDVEAVIRSAVKNIFSRMKVEHR